MHLDESVGVARLDGRSPRRMTAAWLGLDESELTGVPERILAAITDRLLAAAPDRALHEELVEHLRASVDELREMARSDTLTRIANRRAAEERLTDECARSKRHHRALALLLIDVDDLKLVNDTLGHAAGDQALCEVAARLQGSLRLTDFAARWGGDEFVVICPETDEQAAHQLCMKLRGAVAAAPMLLAAADASLYNQKLQHAVRGLRRPLVRVLR